MSSSRFEAFRSEAAELGAENVGRLIEELERREPSGLLRPDELAESSGIPLDVTNTLFGLGSRGDAPLFEELALLRCPACGSRTERRQLAEALEQDEVVECPGCHEAFDSLDSWRREDLTYRFTKEGAEEIAQLQQAEAAKPTATAVILTALPIEQQQVLAQLGETTEEVHPQDTIYKVGEFVGQYVVWRVAVALIGPHNENAAAETERAAAYFDPRVVMFVGVAGGIAEKGVELGDVVVSDEVYAYQSGKAKGEFQPRPLIGKAAYSLKQRALNEVSNETWRDNIKLADTGRAKVFVDPIAAGPQVVADTDSDAYKLIRASYDRVLAIEMEGFGVLAALERMRKVGGIIVRGISDLISNKQEADTAGWQAKAAANAAAFAFHLLHTLTGPEE